jgi:CHASE3 domain sensor protein
MTVIGIPPSECAVIADCPLRFQRQRDELDGFPGGQQTNRSSLFRDAQDGSRGYLLTRQATYLEPLRKAENDLNRRLTGLRQTVPDSRTQLSRIDRVERMSWRTLDTLESIVKQPDSPELASRLDQGRVLLDSINQEFAAMRAEEGNLWVQRILTQTNRRNQLSIGMYAAGILSLLAGIMAMALFVTGIVNRLRVLQQNAERLVRREALANPPPGEDEIGHLGEALARSAVLLSQHEDELRKLNLELNFTVRSTRQLEVETAERQRRKNNCGRPRKWRPWAGSPAASPDFNNILTIIGIR